MQKLIAHSGWSLLTPVEQSALRAIILKLTRMVTGKPQDDHWRDVLGYAVIAAEARYNESEEREMEEAGRAFLSTLSGMSEPETADFIDTLPEPEWR